MKLSTSNRDDFKDFRFCLRMMDPPDVKYDTKDILWMAPLPGRSTSTPILVGDRLFVLAEPDEMLCIDKNTGKTLWSFAVNYYETVTAEEKKANPAFAEKVDPLVARLKAEPNRLKRLALRAEIQKTLMGIDRDRFRIHANDHFEAHFGIVGFTMPTPVSDGKPMVVTQRGDFVRPSDGEILFRPPGSSDAGDTGWSPPVIVGDRLYQPRYGVTSLTVLNLKDVSPTDWEPTVVKKIALPPEVSRGAGGKWIDRWTAGSPLVWDGLAYETDIYHWLYVVDVATGKMLYRQETELDGFTHYNSVAVAASPTLVGKHVLICDNQGTTLVLEPGPKYKVAARNRIATVLDRPWPTPSQETLTYSPPIADGGRLYLRGEAYLYCIGEK